MGNCGDGGQDLVWIYERGRPRHAEGELENLVKPGGGRTCSRVVSRLDGFVSVDAGADGGGFVTPPLTFAGNILKLNVQVHAGGSVRVGLLDEQGRAVPGRDLSDCVAITGDDVELLVRWKDGGEVTPRAGRPTKPRFEMKNASLYAFRFTVGHSGPGRDH